MEEWIKVSGKTVDDAIMEASIQLGISRDHMEVDVLEKETKGFLGIGSRPAVIRARRKEEDPDIISEVFSSETRTQKPQAVKKQSSRETKENKVKENPVKELSEKVPKKKESKEKELTSTDTVASVALDELSREKGKKGQDGAENIRKKDRKKPEGDKSEIVDKKTEVVKVKAEEAKSSRPAADPEEAARRAEVFLTEMLSAMDMEVGIKITYENEALNIELSGENMGVLIGKRGQTLDAIQYLTSLVVNRGNASYVRVKVDTEDYRERRKATLENLARNIAFKVKKTGRPVYLEPMNPYERRIIHATLQNDPAVTTHSEGEDPNRKVVITPRRRENGNSK